MAVMGKTIEECDVPVCDKFYPKFSGGQLCYQVDVNKFIDDVDIKRATKYGLTFFMYYNEEKNFKGSNKEKNLNKAVHKNLWYEKDNEHRNHARVYLDTIGMINNSILYRRLILVSFH